MINPSLTDPNNHVPEVSPDDQWEDAETMHSSGFGSATVLPPKKARPEGAPPNPNDDQGLRIESVKSAAPSGDSCPELEIQEFNGAVVRLDPEMPTPEKVPRHFTFVERPPEDPDKRMRRGEASDWGHARRLPLPWVIGTAAGILAVIVGAMAMLPKINESNAARPPNSALEVVNIGDDQASDSLSRMLGRKPEAEQLFHAYASAPIPADVLPLIADSTQLEPLIRANFIPNRLTKSWIPPDGTTWEIFENNGTPFGVLQGHFPDFSKFRAYLVLSGDQLLIDWKATTAYSSSTFAELARGVGNAGEIRTWITPNTYYSNAFPEADFNCYQLLSANEEEMVWAYAPRGESIAEEISALFRDGFILRPASGPHKATLRLERGSEDALPNQWLIAELLHKEWIQR